MTANAPVHEANRPGFTLQCLFFDASQSGSTHSSRQCCGNMAHVVKSHRGENGKFFFFLFVSQYVAVFHSREKKILFVKIQS